LLADFVVCDGHWQVGNRYHVHLGSIRGVGVRRKQQAADGLVRPGVRAFRP
jgi:hypothetical protein